MTSRHFALSHGGLALGSGWQQSRHEGSACLADQPDPSSLARRS